MGRPITRTPIATRPENMKLFYIFALLLTSSISQVKTQNINVSTSECGVSKGCFLHPGGCETVNDCEFIATWKSMLSEEVAQTANHSLPISVAEIELWGRNYDWLAIYVSEDDRVGDDDVLACHNLDPQVPRIWPKDLYNNVDGDNVVDDSDGNDLTPIQTVYDNSNGAIYCKFHRSIEGSNDRDKDLVVPHYYIFARGSNSLSDDGSSTATSRLPSGGSVIAVAPRRKRIVSYDRITVIYPNLTMIKAHGSLMMFAFLFLIPLGTILSSFYKIVWPNGGWFFAHLFIQIFALLCILAGFIVIFEHARQGQPSPVLLRDTNLLYSHSIIGIICFGFVCINPFLAICRGNPNKRWRRVFFKPVHGFIGFFFVAALGMVNSLLGLNRVSQLIHEINQWVARASIYFAAGTIGAVVIVMALYNAYHIIFIKRVLDPNARVQLQEEDFIRIRFFNKDLSREKVTLEPSKDYIGRVILLGFYALMLGCLVAITMAFFDYLPQNEPSAPLPGYPEIV